MTNAAGKKPLMIILGEAMDTFGVEQHKIDYKIHCFNSRVYELSTRMTELQEEFEKCTDEEQEKKNIIFGEWSCYNHMRDYLCCKIGELNHLRECHMNRWMDDLNLEEPFLFK